MNKKPKPAFYAVRRGVEPGIYRTWSEVEPLVSGFPGAQHKGFATRKEAEDYLGQHVVYPHNADFDSTTAPALGTSSSRSVGTGSREPKVKHTPPRPRPYPAHPPLPVGRLSSSSRSRFKKEEDVRDESEWDVVYTDGSCTNNGGEGAKAGIGVWWGHDDPRNLSERCPGEQTNNRAELIAIIRCLETTPVTDKPLLIKTDSSYSISCIRDWLPRWRGNNFKTATGAPVKNIDVVLYLSHLLNHHRRKIRLQHVKGHAGHEGNEGADFVAQRGTWMDEVPDRIWKFPEVEELESPRQIRAPQTNVKVNEVQNATTTAIAAIAHSISEAKNVGAAVAPTSSAASKPTSPSASAPSKEETIQTTSTSRNISTQESEEYATCLLSADELANEEF